MSITPAGNPATSQFTPPVASSGNSENKPTAGQVPLSKGQSPLTPVVGAGKGKRIEDALRKSVTPMTAPTPLRTIPFQRWNLQEQQVGSTVEHVSVYKTDQLPSLWGISKQSLSEFLNGGKCVYTIDENSTCLPRFAKLNGLNQNGQICKFTALAGVEWFHASSRGLPNIPLRKGLKNYSAALNEYSPDVPPTISIRQLAKEGGSVQGEALEISRLDDIAKASPLQYQSNFHECNDFESFRNLIFDSIDDGKPPIVFFPVHFEGDLDGLPDLDTNDNEHAGIVIGYDKKKNSVSLFQWQKVFHDYPLENLFKASSNLEETREKEHYRVVKNEHLGKDPDRFKWRSGKRKELENDPECTGDVKTSITPRAGMGFKNQVWIVAPGTEPRWNATEA